MLFLAFIATMPCIVYTVSTTALPETNWHYTYNMHMPNPFFVSCNSILSGPDGVHIVVKTDPVSFPLARTSCTSTVHEECYN